MNTELLHGLNSVSVNFRPGDLAFLMARPCTPVPPTPVYGSKTAKKNRGKDRKTMAQKIAETDAAYMAALSADEWTTRAEICSKLKRSTSAVQERMQMLVDEGKVLRQVVTTIKGMAVFYKLAEVSE